MSTLFVCPSAMNVLSGTLTPLVPVTLLFPFHFLPPLRRYYGRLQNGTCRPQPTYPVCPSRTFQTQTPAVGVGFCSDREPYLTRATRLNSSLDVIAIFQKHYSGDRNSYVKPRGHADRCRRQGLRQGRRGRGCGHPRFCFVLRAKGTWTWKQYITLPCHIFSVVP
jgi:hypothetical protein